MIKPITTPGKTYAVTSPNGCTVTTEDGLTLAEIEAGKQGYFVAVSGKVLLSDEAAVLTQLFKLAPQQRLAILGVLGGGDPAWKLKYAECKTVDNMLAVNADYQHDLTSAGEWVYPLPELRSGRTLFQSNKALKIFKQDLPKVTDLYFAFRDSGIKSFRVKTPNLVHAQGTLRQLGDLDLDMTAPKLSVGRAILGDTFVSKAAALKLLNSIPAWTDGATHEFGIGINVDYQGDAEIEEAVAAAEARGWLMSVQWGGTPTASASVTYGLRKPLIYARVDELENGERYLDWGHYVTDTSGYETFRSVEAAREYFGLPEEDSTNISSFS